MNIMRLLPLLLVLVLATIRLGTATSCPNTTTNKGTRPLYLLFLLPTEYGRDNYKVALSTSPKIAQEEINNHSDILPGYHIELIEDTTEICSSSEAGIGLSNLVKHTVSPPCRPLVAVMGLVCSSQISILSPVAGHEGFDLIQLSRASSVIVETQHERFPHLWRNIGAGTVYSDTVLAMMDQFNWTRIGIVYNTDSSFYSELAMDMEQRIKQSGNKSIAFSLGISGTKAYYLDTVISNIKSTETGVLFKLLNFRQSLALLAYTYRHGLIYPHYTWIHVGTHPYALERGLANKELAKSVRGHILLLSDKSVLDDTLLVSGHTFSNYSTKFCSEMKKIQPQFNCARSLIETRNYDQVWAMALALNNSLSELKNRNLSIDNYTIGQPEITAVIETQLKNLRFQGASGWTEFNQYRSVSTSTRVGLVLDNADYKLVGKYNPLYPLDFHVNLNSSDLPSDTVPRVYEYILIPLPVAIVLYILTGGVIIFTTIQLILYLCYRRHKVIKATSPLLSLLMFAGCYLFCAAAIQLNTLGSFVLSPETFTAMAIANYVFIINGISLIFVTLFIKLLRVYRIFQCWNKNLGKQWSNLSLLAVILSLSVIPNICLAVLIILKLPTHSTYYYKFFSGNLPMIEIHTRIEPTSNYTFIGFAASYIIVFLTLVLYLGVRSRKIKMKNFNSSGQVYLLMAVLVIAICLAVSIVIIFLVREQESIANAVMVILFIIFVAACQLILFLPKLLTAAFEGKFPQAMSYPGKLLSFIAQRVFS